MDGTLAEIKRGHGGRHVTVAFDGRADPVALQLFADRRLVSKVDDYGQYAELELSTGADPQELLRALVQADVRLSRFEITEPSLHEVFIDLVGRDVTPSWGPEEVGIA